MKTAIKAPKAYFKLNQTHKAIYEAIRHNETFAAFIMPGEPLSRLKFMADIEGLTPLSDTTFSITPWDTESCDRITLRDTITAHDYLKRIAGTSPDTEAEPDIKPYVESTNELLYKGQVLSIVTDLKKNSPSKTVLSRIICGQLKTDDTANTWLHTVYYYFKELKNTFRFIYYTPSTGFWIGASPELLLSADKATGKAQTVALAGTTFKMSKYNWDDKNIKEHELVVRFIKHKLHSLDIEFDIHETDDVSFGHIIHRCMNFNMNLDKYNPYEVIDQISPTPALSGYPRQDAFKHIGRLEIHDRHCYGGHITIENNATLKAYVNLRCVNFYKNNYCIYTGSGLTEDSIAEKEWRETNEKSALLLGTIKAFDEEPVLQ